MLSRALVFVMALLASVTASAQINFGYYDLDRLGVPKFVNVIYIDLAKVSQVSKFRSSAGHDYHDDAERCRSMKHYFIQPDATTAIYAPVAGTVSRLSSDFVGTQVQIQSDLQPGFIFILFHVNLAAPLAIGDHIAEGQKLGTHIGTQTYSDIAVGVNTPTSYRLVSYFDTLTDAAFAAFQARGITSREQFITSKAERDAAPYTCSGEAFTNLPTSPVDEYVDLSGAQRLNVTNPPEVLSLSDSPYTLAATATSGLPVVVTTYGPCTAAGLQLTLTGTGTCHVLFDQPGNTSFFPSAQFHYVITVLAAPQGPRLSNVYSSSQSVAQSFLRVSNTGTTADLVNVQLINATTGDLLGEWNSPTIPGGSAQQYAISTIENGVNTAFIKPALYTLAIQTKMSGDVQHVVWTPGSGTLTNLSTCDTGVTANRTQINSVHSSLLQAAYPSTVVVTNPTDKATAVQLGVFDAASSVRLGTYTTGPVPAGGQLSLAVPTIEAGARISPTPANYHYIIKAEGSFNGYLQHIVTNTQTGLTSDMTLACPMRLGAAVGVATRIGSVYATAQAEQQSFLRLYNAGAAAGTVRLTLADSATGAQLGAWTSPAIAANASQQFSMGEIENGAGVTSAKPSSYVVTIQSQFSAGYLQHVVWQPNRGTLVNLSTCDDGVTALPNMLINLHSRFVGADYPSTATMTSTETLPVGIGAYLINATTGALLSGYVFNNIPKLGTVQATISALEALPQFPRSTTAVHYNFKPQSAFKGFFQHLVSNARAGVTTDMTAMCRIN